MLNCVNNLNLEPQSMNSGIERAALMVSEEKQDSRKNFISSLSLLHTIFCHHPFSFGYRWNFFEVFVLYWIERFSVKIIIVLWCHNFLLLLFSITSRCIFYHFPLPTDSIHSTYLFTNEKSSFSFVIFRSQKISFYIKTTFSCHLKLQLCALLHVSQFIIISSYLFSV